jgi:putative transposon-encoded protein
MRKEDLSFSEPYAAAKSLKNFWTKMASTYKCIFVGVSGKILIIRPNWYIGWAIYLLGLDLDHEIRVDYIKSVEKVGNWYGYGMVKVTYTMSNAEDRSIILYLRKHIEFMHVLNAYSEPET